MEMLDKVMPLWFAASIFLGVFAGCMGVYCARAISLVVRDMYELSVGGREPAKRLCHHWKVGEL
jgi:H+/Cl- antiporter ClcA